jgi:hypothetical protein
MKTRTFLSIIALWTPIALALSSCSSPTEPEPGTPTPPVEKTLPDGYPPVPKPSDPLDLDQPMQSDTLTIVMPIDGKPVDFAPTWSAGNFTWYVDVQTQALQCFQTCEWSGYQPGRYWDGTRHSSNLIFEGGAVDLRHPTPSYRGANVIPRQLLFIEDGAVVATPRNPGARVGYFDYMPPNQSGGSYPSKTINPCLFSGAAFVSLDPGFLQKEKRAEYLVAATACPQLTSPVYVKRERFWTRVLIDGKKSIRVDPGNTFEVAYQKTEGTSSANSKTIAQTLNGSLGAGATGGAITGSLGYSLSETFETTVTVTEESSVTVTRTVTGIEGKTVIYSVWSSVERYTIVDANGEKYTDPNFTFADLGSTEIQGEYEWLSSTIFDYE